MERDKTRQLVGTPVYDNWRAYLNGTPRLGGYEYVLHSDAHVTGEVTTGVQPYAFINLVSFGQERGRVRPAVAVRAWVHVDFDAPKMDKTDQSRYHGGDAADEVAALASLVCGVRFRALMSEVILWGGLLLGARAPTPSYLLAFAVLCCQASRESIP